MKFVDEATISVHAGNGGHGALSFRREKYIEKGGPDGGDGGRGGSVYLVAKAGTNTLADFRVGRKYRAPSGQPGAGNNKSGKSGEDLDVIVPCGTVVHDVDTGERVLPIWIGPGEASAIAMELAGMKFSRPLTHDLAASLIRGMGGQLTRVLITRVEENTYFAELVIQRGSEVFSVDARPSDSIAIALRMQARGQRLVGVHGQRGAVARILERGPGGHPASAGHGQGNRLGRKLAQACTRQPFGRMTSLTW